MLRSTKMKIRKTDTLKKLGSALISVSTCFLMLGSAFKDLRGRKTLMVLNVRRFLEDAPKETSIILNDNMTNMSNLPCKHNDKVYTVPSIPEIGSLMLKEAICNDFKYRFECVNNGEERVHSV